MSAEQVVLMASKQWKRSNRHPQRRLRLIDREDAEQTDSGKERDFEMVLACNMRVHPKVRGFLIGRELD
jgi:hypothetical protein